jgi:hypothetical protein
VDTTRVVPETILELARRCSGLFATLERKQLLKVHVADSLDIGHWQTLFNCSCPFALRQMLLAYDVVKSPFAACIVGMIVPLRGTLPRGRGEGAVLALPLLGLGKQVGVFSI